MSPQKKIEKDHFYCQYLWMSPEYNCEKKKIYLSSYTGKNWFSWAPVEQDIHEVETSFSPVKTGFSWMEQIPPPQKKTSFLIRNQFFHKQKSFSLPIWQQDLNPALPCSSSRVKRCSFQGAPPSGSRRTCPLGWTENRASMAWLTIFLGIKQHIIYLWFICIWFS